MFESNIYIKVPAMPFVRGVLNLLSQVGHLVSRCILAQAYHAL
jgi:hypothetical protein